MKHRNLTPANQRAEAIQGSPTASPREFTAASLIAHQSPGCLADSRKMFYFKIAGLLAVGFCLHRLAPQLDRMCHLHQMYELHSRQVISACLPPFTKDELEMFREA